jgi:3-keto-L-gulonate-6-phosphate decarboxylase
MAAAAGALKPVVGIAGAIQASAVLLLLSAVALVIVGRAITARPSTAKT